MVWVRGTLRLTPLLLAFDTDTLRVGQTLYNLRFLICVRVSVRHHWQRAEDGIILERCSSIVESNIVELRILTSPKIVLQLDGWLNYYSVLMSTYPSVCSEDQSHFGSDDYRI